MDNGKVVYRLKRYDPNTGGYRESVYEVPTYRGMTILDGLIWIKENLDRTVSYRASCRMGLCGSCGMTVNGRPTLTCETQIASLGTDEITIEPLNNMEPIRDVVADFHLFFKHQRAVKPYLIRKNLDEQVEPTREYLQDPQEWNLYIQFAMCITCGLCYSACPTTSTNERYLGPQALANLFRFFIDSRDEGWEERLNIADTEDGVWGCHLATGCSEVCPKGVDPALAIQLLRKEILKRSLRLSRPKKAREVAPMLPPSEESPYRAFGEAPEFTVEDAVEKAEEFNILHDHRKR